jgi:signal transduction histidine kinase
LAGFLASLALLAPLVWLIARRTTAPIRVFAAAAERLGADPEAPPLEMHGPAEVRTAVAAFNEMQAGLRRYVRGRTELVAAIAHDLRTPLTRLRFRAEQAEPAVRDRMAEDIEQMDAMIAQVLAFVRGEAVREPRAVLDLSTLVGSICHDLVEVGATATCSAPERVMVEAEPLNLRRAVTNLIENAVKFGGRASVTVRREGAQAVVEIDDEGPGLPDDELDRVFEPFHRVERSRSRETGGAGLGLALARTVARAHGGTITLANRERRGLRARLALPAQP